MGATYEAKTAVGATPEEALTAMLDAWLADYMSWDDPRSKGYVEAWDKPVTDDAIEWMQGWVMQSPPEGVDPNDKWGPWLMFPLASGGWRFFGWVNT